MEESIQAFNNYRKQNNAVILQLQNEIRLLKASIITSNNPSTNNNNSLVDLEIIEEVEYTPVELIKPTSGTPDIIQIVMRSVFNKD